MTDHNCQNCGHHRTSRLHKAQAKECAKKNQELYKKREKTPPNKTNVLPFQAKRYKNGSYSKTEFY